MPPKMFFGLDFNVHTMACVVMGRYSDGTLVVVDELVLHNSNTEEMARLMRKSTHTLKTVILTLLAKAEAQWQ